MTLTNNKNLSTLAHDAALNKLSQASIFMQYGCNEFTFEAIESNKIQSVIVVESDKGLSDKLYEKVSNKDKLHLMYTNLGTVDGNGMPIDDAQFKQFHQYMVLPWALADKYNAMPDLILIDGPFKVACFLYSLICAAEGTTILFNDFFVSEEYAVARDYALLESRHGDMAEFVVQKNFVMSELAAMVAKYSVISD